MPLTQWTKIALSLAAALSASAQVSNITQCIPAFQWTINSKGQTPCLVAAFLESACGSPTSVNGIPLNTHYLGPTGAQQGPCICSSVTYSMVSACGGCQGRTYQNWTTWSENCDNPSLTTFPEPIPSGAVEVPVWAFLNVSLTNDTLDPVVAQDVLAGTPPPTTAITPTSSTSSVTTTSDSLISTSLVPSYTPIAASSNSGDTKHSNSGAIAGGVVGGLVFFAVLVLAGLWWYMRRRRNAVQRDITFDHRALVAPPVTSQVTGSSGLPGGHFQQSLYDTSNPSTYPSSPLTSAVYTTKPGSRRSLESISHSMAQFGGYQTASAQQPAGYRGAAEV